MKCPTPAGAFYAFPTVPDAAENAESFVYSLLREEGVATVPGTVFDTIGKGRFRIAYSNSAARIEEAFERIEDWIEAR